jgi:exodeoxyribonuclease V alpha subunit
VELRRSHRFGADTVLAEIAAAIRRGEPAALRGLLGAHQERVTRVEPREDGLAGELAAPILAGLRALAEPGVATLERLARVDRVRLLCALKEGPRGVAGAGLVAEACARGERLGRGRRSIEQHRGLILGDPVIVRRNDHGQRLYNGDVGVAVEGPGGLWIAFPDREGVPRLVRPTRLPPWEKAWALSVHQSQGSEFEDVALVLPDRDARVLTRELLYTAVTRARGRVWIHGSWSVLDLAVRKQIRRASGLAARLRQP